MKESLKAGISKTVRIEINRERTIDFMGEVCRVYATPELVRDIEMTSRDLLLEHLDEGEDSVGTRVSIDHMAATLMGMWVDVSVSVSKVQGKMISLEVACNDAVEAVAKGNHNRFIVNNAVTAERLKAKAAKAGA